MVAVTMVRILAQRRRAVVGAGLITRHTKWAPLGALHFDEKQRTLLAVAPLPERQMLIFESIHSTWHKCLLCDKADHGDF